MVNIVNILLNTVAIGSLYALVAIGFTLIFGVGGVFNLAHGAFVALGGFITYLTVNRLGFGIWLALVTAALAVGVIGALFYLTVIEPIESSTVAVLILTLLVGFLVQHLFGVFVTKQTISVPQVIMGTTDVFGTTILNNMIFVFASTWLFISGLFLLVERTPVGKAILAMSMSEKGASLVGIDHRRAKLLTWFIASVFAGFAGVLLISYQTGQWNMGTQPLMLSFTIVVLGGLGSIKGSVVASYIIGFIEVFTTSVIHPELTGAVPLALLVVILLVRPQGLFGRMEAI